MKTFLVVACLLVIHCCCVWSAAPSDVEELKEYGISKRCVAKCGLSAAMCTAKKSKIQDFEPSCPLYFGWFPSQNDANQLIQLASDLWNSLLLIDDVINILNRDFKSASSGKREINNFKNWFTIQEDEPLHVTAKFCLYGQADGAREYCNSKNVLNSQGCSFPIEVTSILITPRTIGAVVKLPDNVLLPNGTFPLWQNDDNQIVNEDGSPGLPGGASRPPGSRAHITLAVASGIQAVQTGFDVLQLWDINHRSSANSSSSAASDDDAFRIVTQWGTVQSFAKGLFKLQFEPPRLLNTLFTPRF